MSRLQSNDPRELAIRLAAIVDSSDDAIISTELDTTITTWNAAATRMFGFHADEVLGHPALLIVPPDMQEEELARFESVKSGDKVEHYQTQRLRKGGGRLDVSLTISPIKVDGVVVGASFIARDIARQLQSEDARRRLASIVESSDDAIVSKDMRGIITSWNSGAEKMFGYAADEMIGRSVMVLIPPELQYSEAEIISKLRRGERIVHYETQRVRKGGELIDVSLTISPIYNASGQVVGASKIARDISERRRVEEARIRLAAIVESSDDAIIGKDLDGVITSWNSGAKRIFGYEPEEIIGHSVLRLIPPELRSEEPMILARLRAGNRVDHYESKRVTKYGDIIDVSLTSSPIKDSTGKVIGASKIVRDISGKKRAEAALIERERVAATGRMAAALAHEVNNPLEAIMNIAYLLDKDTSLSPRARGFAELLLSEVQRASEITKQTLSFYRNSAEAADVPLAPLLDSVVSTKKDKLIAKSIDIQKEQVGDVVVWGFAGELRQVFSNLLDNAIYAVGEKGRIRIRIRQLQRTGEVRISVCDNGAGMSPSTMRKIFEPFFTTKASKGSGLGLWVTNGIIHKHGGRVWVRSNQKQERHGSIFTITLPVKEARSRPVRTKSIAAV